MKETLRVLAMAIPLSIGTAGLAQGQTASSTTSTNTTRDPVADAARKARAERAKESQKPVKVFTNDSVPTAWGISVVGPPPSEESEETGKAGPEAGTARDKQRQEVRTEMQKLRSNLDLHQRQLAVLQQKLNLAQLQFSFNPNDTLQQETFRTDIDTQTKQVQEKQQQVADDQNAISDYQDQVLREGGDPGWLNVPAGTGPGAASSGSSTQTPVKLPKAGTREYWQQRFQMARDKLARAQEEEQLAEDELGLLQTRQAQELNPASQSELARAVPAKQADVAAKRAAVDKAKEELDAVEKEFQAGGFPADWSQTQPLAPSRTDPKS